MKPQIDPVRYNNKLIEDQATAIILSHGVISWLQS